MSTPSVPLPPPLAQRPAWKALTAHAEDLRPQQLRDLFKSDPARGTRLTAEAEGIFLDYSKNRVTDETLKLLLATRRAIRPQAAHRGHVHRREDQHHREPRRAARRSARAEVANRSSSTAKTSFPRSTPCSTRCPPSPTASAAASGKATPASASATSSTSASAAPTSVRSWPTKRSSTTRSATSPSASSPTSTAPTSPKPSRDLAPDETLFLVASQDLHHARDHDQRALRARLVPRELRRTGVRHRQALRRALHQRQARQRLRHRHRQHVRLLGLGRRPLLHGLRHRPLAP